MITLKRILVATDFSEPSDVALSYGRELATRFKATLHVLHVAQNVYISTFGAENYAAIAPDLQQQIEEGARLRLSELLIDSDQSGPNTIAAVITATSPAFAIVDYAKDHEIDIIVMGTHGRGALAHLVMGSVAERAVRFASCPVLTVRHPEHEFVRPDTLIAAAREQGTADGPASIGASSACVDASGDEVGPPSTRVALTPRPRVRADRPDSRSRSSSR